LERFSVSRFRGRGRGISLVRGIRFGRRGQVSLGRTDDNEDTEQKGVYVENGVVMDWTSMDAAWDSWVTRESEPASKAFWVI
jgi:hypothetical protein